MDNQNAHILVVIGPDPASPDDSMFATDLSAFDATKEVTGLSFTRLMNPTFQDFIDHMRRFRIQQQTTIYCHIAAHMDPAGINFRDQHVTPDKLAVHLSGVEVLFLAGCESAAVGDLLGVVPYIVTLLESIDNRSARILTERFWLAIGSGYTAPEAYNAALAPLPDLAQYAYLHRHGFLSGRGKPTGRAKPT